MNQETTPMFASFYSYKGGVGRTMLCANVAAYLCYKMGKKVLLWDWDMEAPGLHYYFEKAPEKIEGSKENKGTIDLLTDYVDEYRKDYFDIGKGERDISEIGKLPEVCSVIRPENGGGKIDLLPAGNYSDKSAYIAKVNAFNWGDFYDVYYGGEYIDRLKDWAADEGYDYVLIDSRTGITDYSGVTTIHLPDLLVAVMTPNKQNIEGTKDVIDRILNSAYLQDRKNAKARRESEGNVQPMYVFPVLSRLDAGNPDRDKWVDTFVDTFSSHLEAIDLDISEATPFSKPIFRDFFMEETLLEYYTAYSAGERLLPEAKHQYVRSGLLSKYANVCSYMVNLHKRGSIEIMRRISVEDWIQYARDVDTEFDGKNEEEKNKLRAYANTKAERFEEAVKWGGTYEAYLGLGKVASKIEDYNEAIIQFKKANEIAIEEEGNDKWKDSFIEARIGLVWCFREVSHLGTEKEKKDLMKLLSPEKNLKKIKRIESMLELALFYEGEGKYPWAEQTFDYIIDRKPKGWKSTKPYERLGDNCLVLNKFEKAKENYLLALQETQDDDVSDTTELYLYVQACKAYVKWVEKELKEKELKGTTAQSGERKKWDAVDKEAAAFLIATAKKYPMEKDILIYLGKYYLLINKPLKAITEFKKIPNNDRMPWTGMGEAYYLQGKWYQKREAHEEAKKHYEKASDYFKGWVESVGEDEKLASRFYKLLIEMTVYFAEKWEEVEQYTDLYFKRNREDDDVRIWRAQALFELNRPEEAFETLVLFHQDVRGNTFTNNVSSSATNIEANNQAHDNKGVAYQLLGRIYLDVKDFGLAVHYLRQANKHLSKPDVKHQLAEALLKYADELTSPTHQEKDDLYIQAANLLDELTPLELPGTGYKAVNRYELLCDSGVAWERTKDLEKAEARYEDAVKLDPNKPDAYIHQAALHYSRREYEQAAERLKAYLKQADGKLDSDVYYNLAKIGFVNQDYPGTLADLIYAKREDDWDWLLLYSAASLFVDNQNEATEYVELASELLDKERSETYPTKVKTVECVKRHQRSIDDRASKLACLQACGILLKDNQDTNGKARQFIWDAFHFAERDRLRVEAHTRWFLPNLQSKALAAAQKLQELVEQLG